MKLAWFFAILLAIQAFAQSSTPHGTRIGQVQTEYLQGPDGIQSVAQERMRQDSRVERQKIEAARTAPETPAATMDRLRTIILTPRDRGPRMEFETWVEQASRDFAESVVTGTADVERQDGKTTVHRFVRDNFSAPIRPIR